MYGVHGGDKGYVGNSLELWSYTSDPLWSRASPALQYTERSHGHKKFSSLSTDMNCASAVLAEATPTAALRHHLGRMDQEETLHTKGAA